MTGVAQPGPGDPTTPGTVGSPDPIAPIPLDTLTDGIEMSAAAIAIADRAEAALAAYLGMAALELDADTLRSWIHALQALQGIQIMCGRTRPGEPGHDHEQVAFHGIMSYVLARRLARLPGDEAT